MNSTVLHSTKISINKPAEATEVQIHFENTHPHINNVLTFPTGEPVEGGKGGEAGVLTITNSEFITTVFPVLPEGAFAAVCSKSGDPGSGGWTAKRANEFIGHLSADKNNYFNCSSFNLSDDGILKAKKENFAGCHFFMLDDLGTKVPFEMLGDFKLSWLIETSSGNFQGGIILAEPITDGAKAVQLLNAIIDAGLCDKGASGPLSRWSRLPNAINGKSKYGDETGNPFNCRLVKWDPENRYTPEQIIDGLKLELTPAGHPKKLAKTSPPHLNTPLRDDDVWIPMAEENPVLSMLKDLGLYKMPLGSGKHDITCPWKHEHTDELDNGAAYFEPDDTYAFGGFCCQHSHRALFHIRQLLDHLGVSSTKARHKPVIRVIAGHLDRVIKSAEKALVIRGHHYQVGGLIASILTDPTTADPSIVPTNVHALTREVSIAATWEKFDSRSKSFVNCDPPATHIANLYGGQKFNHLLPLSGLTRQPYFRPTDGELVMQAGYDKTSQLFGVFDARQFVIPDPTPDEAHKALDLLEELLTEFHFVSDTDKAAALSAIFTAVVRPTFAFAPGFHVRAPVFGSGKSYLCELIGAFAGPAGNAKVSYPTTSEEATKAMLSLLLTGPAVIEFDDMDTDWIPHGVIKRMFTAEHITDRILGGSKVGTVSTRTLFLGSGNNVGPVSDMQRRILTIHLDPRCSTPATISYANEPLKKVRKNRGVYVTAVLTIIMAWRAAGSPHISVKNIATFDGAWSDYCRQPLMWLGHPDPITAMLEQLKHDPDAEALASLINEWHVEFGSKATTVRKAVDLAEEKNPLLLDAIRDFSDEDKGEINRSKLGHILKKNANRVVDGYYFQQSRADGRVAWKVVAVKPPPLTPLTPLPPSTGSGAKTVAHEASKVLVVS